MINLESLIKEINYQEEYSYDKRADLFNTYSISTSQNFFNPIYELAKFICDRRSYYKSEISSYESYQKGCFNSCYSHSGNIASAFNKTWNTVKPEFQTVKLYKTGMIRVYGLSKGLTLDVPNKLVPLLDFNVDKTVTIHALSAPNTIPRNLYDQIDRWLLDFGYAKW